ncbi:hypothetical protein ACF1BP_36375 [Streptomyces sp. NPDC014735]|uniref:hypothetical protein n=1 Tax=unclassified Streptomyces TaxID=2593676 RepID=UPI003700A1F6
MSVVLAVMGASVLLGGCVEAAGPQSAGHASVAPAPVRLWPKKPPAPRPAPHWYGPDKPTPLPGLPKVPSGDIRQLDAASVVAAQIADHARRQRPAFDKNMRKRINRCSAEPEQCPVRTPEYQDLTGDGKDELIIGIEERQHALVLWVYRLQDGALTQILNTAGRVLTVEVADGDLVMRESSDSAGYEARTVFSWDSAHQIMMSNEMDYDRKTPAPSPEPVQ